MRIRGYKRILFLVVLSVVIVVSAYGIWQKVMEERRYRGNLLKNFSFEMIDTSGKLPFWAEDSRGGWSVSTEGPYEGERCMQATVGWSRLRQYLPAREGKYYTLKAYLKSDITIPAKTNFENAFLGLECLDEEGKTIKNEYGVTNAPPFWQQKVRQIYAPPGTAQVMAKLAKRQGEGSVWFDSVKLEESPSVLISNSGFEMVDQLGRLDAWAEDAKGGWSVSTEDSYEGERSVKATISWSWLWQEVPVRPERYYTLNAFLKSDIAPSEKEDRWNAFLALECLDKERKVIVQQMRQLEAGSLWSPYGVSIYAPQNTDKIRVKLAKRRGEGSIWFDNLEISEAAWYMKMKFLKRVMDDKPFFIFYFAIYFILLIFLIRLILKR